jgi:hypothetical protein
MFQEDKMHWDVRKIARFCEIQFSPFREFDETGEMILLSFYSIASLVFCRLARYRSLDEPLRQQRSLFDFVSVSRSAISACAGRGSSDLNGKAG